MTWAKLDDRLHSNRKVRKAGLEAMGLWVIGLSYCAFELTDGFIDHEWIQMWSGPKTDELCSRLVASGLWSEVDGGYQYNDYLDYNPSAKDVLAAREQSNARQMRRRKKGSAEHVTDDVTHVVTRDSRRDNESTPNEVTRDSRHKSRVSHTTPDPDPDPERAHTQGAREAVESTQMPPSLPVASSPASAVRATAQGEILAALQSHEALALVATARFAEQLEGRRMGKGSLVAWIVTAIDDAARDAGAEAAAGHPLSAPELAKLVSRFCDRARAPREPIADTRRGQGATKRDGEQPPPLPPYYRPFQFEPRVKVTPEEAERRIRSLDALKPRSVREAEAEAARLKAANSVEPEGEAV